MDAYSWIELVVLGALLGAAGQGMRTIVGLKGLYDAASASNVSATSLLEVGRLVVSFLIGAIAGALASVSTIGDIQHISSNQILALIAAGYAGADFIEGFMRRVQAPDPGAGPAGGTAADGAANDGAAG